MGTPAFAVPSLRALAAHHDVLAVYTRPDRPRGRGRRPVPSPVKAAAEELSLPVAQPPTLRDPDAVSALTDLAPEVICVAAYGLLLPPNVLAVPPLGCVNVHASLLPAYRGAAPVQRAILDGVETTGVSIMSMAPEMDAGPYAAQVRAHVGDADLDTLMGTLSRLGADALIAVLAEMERGTAVWIAQDDSSATFAPKISAEDVALDPTLPAETALRRVRASSRSTPARARVAGTGLVVLSAAPSSRRVAPGKVAVGKSSFVLGVADGTIELLAVRPEGRAEMPAAAFARGARLDAAARWEAWR